jgi:hypothetical protein
MARPIKLGLEYFPLDVDIFDDEKVIPVTAEYGFKGELILIRVLCAIYRNGYFAERSDSLIFKLAKQTGVNHSLVSDVISGLVRWGFFDKTVFDSVGILTSRGIQKRWKEAVRKRVIDTSKLSYWILQENEKNEFTAEETPVSGGRNANKQEFPAEETTQKKRKENKVNNKPPLIPPNGGNDGEVFITKKKRKLTGKRLDTFLIFWEKFDYRKGKAEAADSWIDIPELTIALCEKIYAAAEAEAKRRPELEASGKTPKMAQGWISSRRWEDEIYSLSSVKNQEKKQSQRCER